MKASTQISAWTDFTRTYNNYTYGFYTVGGSSGLPQNYSFNSDVIDYVIKSCGEFQIRQVRDRSQVVPVQWVYETADIIMNQVYSTIVNAYTATASFIHDFVLSSAQTYAWDFEFTGADPDYPGWDTYGTAYGFRFTGICGDKIDLVLDYLGNFYGHNPIGNYTIDPNATPYQWIGVNQTNTDPDNPEFYTPQVSFSQFHDLKSPYIEGISMHFFVYDNQFNEKEFIVPDFRDTVIYMQESYRIRMIKILGDPTVMRINTGNQTDIGNYNSSFRVAYDGLHGSKVVFQMYDLYLSNHSGSGSNCSLSLPVYYTLQNYQNNVGSPNILGIYEGSTVSGFGDIYLSTQSYTPVTNPNPIPETPIPITEIPSNPDTPLPSSPIPTPVPGITYPEPYIPLPPFASIVSGNDDLWGITLDFEGAQDGLLPYMNSLSEFQFPSFSNLISDFSGSIIWVAQIMSILYNGTSFNVLFIALCLFSLVSILIGAYKLWATTEPDPNNPGFRRSKRPPKPPKGRRRR